MDKNTKSSKTGLSFTGALQIAFIVLKLCGVIQWSWLWVLAPIWVSLIILVLILVVIGLLNK